MRTIAAGMLLPLLLSGAALAQEKPTTLDKAGNIVRQPARDVGIEKGKIPEVLQEAVENPYAPLPSRRADVIPTCAEPDSREGFTSR